MVYGAILAWLGVRRPSRPAGRPLRVVMALAVLVAVAGATAAVILEARLASPWTKLRRHSRRSEFPGAKRAAGCTKRR